MNRPFYPFKTVLVPALILLTFLLVQSARSAQFYVYMTDNLTFDPSFLEIQFGDIVTWQGADDFDCHDSVSDGGYWATPCLDYGQTYSLQFFLTGTFPYRDSFYGPGGMTGTIVVTEPPPPQPLITNLATLPNGSFKFTVTNLVVGKTNIIQASTNLFNWTNLYTNIASSTGFIYTDTAAPNFKRQRFYRAWVLP